MEIFKPRMEGLKPPAETVMNCMGAITNIPCTVQDFFKAGLPVWFLRPSTVWDGSESVRCNVLKTVTPLNPADVLCVSEHFPPFRSIFYGSSNDLKNIMLSLLIHGIGWYSKTHLGVQRVSRSNFSSTHLLTFFKGSTSSIISASSSPSISSSQSTSTIQSAGRGKTFTGISSSSTLYVYSFILVWYISSHIILKS